MEIIFTVWLLMHSARVSGGGVSSMHSSKLCIGLGGSGVNPLMKGEEIDKGGVVGVVDICVCWMVMRVLSEG